MVKKVSVKDIFTFAEALSILALARFILIFVPFSKILPFMGNPVSETGNVDGGKKELQNLRIAIARACNYSFWRTKCFEQALCAKLMLKCRKKDSTIVFGVKKDAHTQEFSAHAWVVCNEEIVTGGRQAGEFQIISRFYG